MVLDGIICSPRTTKRMPSFRKAQFQQNDQLGSWSALVKRHRFLLTALVGLAFLCTIYLYFAITLGASSSSSSPCSGLTAAEKALCRLKNTEASMTRGKLKIL